MKSFTLSNNNSSKNLFITFLLVVTTSIASLNAQVTITPGTNLVLNGNVSLVLNNSALENNGKFAAGSSTVDFSGYNDTMVSYISGRNATTFNNLSVSKPAFGIALKSAVAVKNVLAVNAGNLYTDSNLTLKSDVSLTARVAPVAAGSSIIGKANVERYINARRAWRLMTAPVSNSSTIYNSWQNKGVYAAGQGTLITGANPSEKNGLDVSAQNTTSMKGFNSNTQGFTSILNTNVAISAGKNGNADNTGYFIFLRGDRNQANTNINNSNSTTLVSNGSLQTGEQTFPAASVANKYTLIGNPYASPVDFNNIKRNNLLKRFYVWDPSLNTVGGYVMMDDLDNDGVYEKTVKGSTQTKDIQSGQAFFVQTSATAAASITFSESGKSVNTNGIMFRPVGNTTGTATGMIRTTLNLLNEDSTTILADGVIAQFNDIFSAGVDMDDASKFSNTNENIGIVRNNALLAAERRPSLGANDTVYFKLSTTTQRSYQFVFEVSNLEQPGMMAFLQDSYLGTNTPINLSGVTTVNFAINGETASAATTRFRIVFKASVVVLPVTISSVKAQQQNNNIAVEWKVENELNMVKYDVEKSTDGVAFMQVNTINVNGNSNTYNTYSWLDVNSALGNNFYRIKSYDRSGEIKYSSVVKVSISKGATASSFSIYPNLVTGNVINLVMNNQPAGKYQVRLTSINGQSIFVKSIQTIGGNSVESLNTGNKLAAGIYQLEIIGQNNSHNTQKVIVE
ncbi:MAG: T9SS type A sorting domain-containing protein [Ferruginibacter sp.]